MPWSFLDPDGLSAARAAECRVSRHELLFVGLKSSQEPLALQVPVAHAASYQCFDLTTAETLKSDLYGTARGLLIMVSVLLLVRSVTQGTQGLPLLFVLIVGLVVFTLLLLLFVGAKLLFRALFENPKNIFVLLDPESQGRIRFWVHYPS